MRPGRYHSFNWRMLLRVMGWLLFIEAGFMLVPVITGLCYGESDWKVFALTSLFTAAVGLAVTRYSSPRSSSMGRREGFMLTASVWVVFSLFGMLPFIFCSVPQSLSVSFFEAMSGFTTTGATALNDIAGMSRAITVWRALMQWLGGMGIILFTLAVLPKLNSAGGMQMFNAEVTGIIHDKLHPRISQTAFDLWKLYAVLTGVCALMLWLGPMDAFDAVCHAFGTLSTGGFTTSPTGIDQWDSLYVKTVITVFMMVGGINFVLIFKLMDMRFREVWQNNTFRLYLLLILVCAVIFSLSSWLQSGVTGAEQLTVDPLFRVVSAISSTGYNVGTAENYGTLTFFLMMPLIFFGGCAGSTSGGAKLDRAIVMGKFAVNEIRRALQPNSVLAVKAGNTVLPIESVQKVLAFIIIYMGAILAGATVLSAMGVDMGDAMVTSLTAISNSTIIDIEQIHAAIPQGGLWILALLMLIGRLEVFTVVVLFLPQFWRK